MRVSTITFRFLSERKNSRIKELEPRVKSAAEAINSLKDIIKKKDDEIKTQEEKYKKFLGKAKQVRESLNKSSSNMPRSEVMSRDGLKSPGCISSLRLKSTSHLDSGSVDVNFDIVRLETDSETGLYVCF